jgi:hypothetical protein
MLRISSIVTEARAFGAARILLLALAAIYYVSLSSALTSQPSPFFGQSGAAFHRFAPNIVESDPSAFNRPQHGFEGLVHPTQKLPLHRSSISRFV